MKARLLAHLIIDLGELERLLGLRGQGPFQLAHLILHLHARDLRQQLCAAQPDGVIQGTFGVIQSTFGVIQGTFGVIQGTFGMIQGELSGRP
jgi:hypothetical protein